MVGVSLLLTVGLFLVAGIGPALFWLWIVWRQDRLEKEPKRLIFTTFLFGMLATIPAAIAEVVLGADLDPQTGSIATLAVSTLLIVGPIEELAKCAVVWFWSYRKPAFNEPMDGLVYAAASAMGFAGFENLLYIIDSGPEVMLIRGPLSTLAHLLFAIPWGLALGRYKAGTLSPVGVILALAFAAFGHGLFDFFLVALQAGAAWGLLALLLLPLMYFYWRRASRAFHQAARESPFSLQSAPIRPRGAFPVQPSSGDRLAEKSEPKEDEADNRPAIDRIEG